MKNTILIGVLLWCVWSCTKEDKAPTVTYGTAYAKSGVSPTTSSRGFTTSGEIKDAAQIAQLESPARSALAYLAADLANNPNGNLDTLFFESQTLARVNDQRKASRYTVTSKDTALLLTSVDTLTGIQSEIEMSRNLLYHLPDPRKLLFDEYISSVQQGTYYFNYRYQNRFLVLPGNGQTLAIPMIAYSWTHKLNNLSSGIFFNTMTGPLDTTFYRSIPEGDAVVVREFTLYYTK
jgi:hypothetical protein